MISVDTGSDLHTHSDLTDGAATPEQMAQAALAAGLHTWGLSDHVRADSHWVADYVRVVRGLDVGDLVVRCGVEAKMLDTSGALDLPPALPPLDYVLVADHQFPGPDGPRHPRDVAGLLDDGRLAAGDAVDQLVEASCAALRASPFRPILAHPFSLLPKLGRSEDDVTDEHLRALAAACHDAGAAVELNEKWACPTSSVAARLATLSVELVAGSDAHRCADVGAWRRLPQLLDTLAGTTVRTAVPSP